YLQYLSHLRMLQLCQLFRCQYAHAEDGDDDVEGEKSQKSGDGSLPHVAGISGSGREDDGAFYSDERPHCGRGSDHYLSSQRHSAVSPEIVHEDVDAEF